MKIAITGGIAVGKSTVCRYFKKLGAYTVDADKIVHELLSTTELKDQIIKLLGKDIVENDKISRKKIAKKVFNDAKKLKQLEEWIHPLVIQEIKKRYQQAKKTTNYSCFVVEMPLLFEQKEEKYYDFIIVVAANDDICKKRFQKKDFEKRKKRQISLEKKMAKSDFIITNNASFANVKKQVNHFFETLIKETPCSWTKKK